MNLDRPLSWQKSTHNPDQYGQEIETWVDHKTIWGQLMPMRGYSTFEALQKVAVGNTRFAIRFDEGFEPKDRIEALDTGKIYEIESIQEYNPYRSDNASTRREYLILDCRDRDNGNES